MGNKFSNKYIWVLMLVLGVFVMAVTALIGGNSSIRNAQQTAQRTLQYLQNQCISYRDIVAADRLKSLVRLTEQSRRAHMRMSSAIFLMMLMLRAVSFLPSSSPKMSIMFSTFFANWL